jgi:hypothetical protein
MVGSLAAITIELPTDTPTKTVFGSTITTEDYYAQQFENTSLHYYVVNIPAGTINANYDKGNIQSTLNTKAALAYPITSRTTYMKLVANWTDENGKEHPTYKNYTTYTTGAASVSIRTQTSRWWVIELETGALKSGFFNTTIGSTLFDPTISACGFLNGANTIFTLNQSVAINGSTCFTFNATNQTLDCNGWSIT